MYLGYFVKFRLLVGKNVIFKCVGYNMKYKNL